MALPVKKRSENGRPVKRFSPFVVAGLLLVLLGVGCEPSFHQSVSEEQAALSLVFDGGEQVMLRPTVLGVGGMIADWVGGDSSETTVSVVSYVPGQEATVEWVRSEQVETEASVEARRVYTETYGTPGIGEDVPEEPEQMFETIEHGGEFRVTGLGDAREIVLPDLFEAVESDSDTSGLWLSREQYDELVSTRTTTFSLGLFDQSLADAQAVTSKVGGYMDQLSGLVDTISQTVQEGEIPDSLLPGEAVDDEEPVNRIESRSDWGSYDLVVNGERMRVRTIEASNAFGSFTFLAN